MTDNEKVGGVPADPSALGNAGYPGDQTGQELELAARRELAISGVGALSEVFGVEVSVSQLLETSENDHVEPDVRLQAKRGLRFVAALGEKNSSLARCLEADDPMTTEGNVYAAAEAFVFFGASERRYPKLVSEVGLRPAEATAVYALRERLLEAHGSAESLGTILKTLETLGIGSRELVTDPDGVLDTLDASACFKQTSKRGTGGRSYLQTTAMEHSVVSGDPDGSISAGITAATRNYDGEELD
jgi:hypothetical protein